VDLDVIDRILVCICQALDKKTKMGTHWNSGSAIYELKQIIRPSSEGDLLWCIHCVWCAVQLTVVLIKMGFIETYSKAWICYCIKHLSTLSIPVTIPFKLASHRYVPNVRENQAAFKMNGALPDFTLCWHNSKKQTHKSLINR
jgi:hypothetical protein